MEAIGTCAQMKPISKTSSETRWERGEPCPPGETKSERFHNARFARTRMAPLPGDAETGSASGTLAARCCDCHEDAQLPPAPRGNNAGVVAIGKFFLVDRKQNIAIFRPVLQAGQSGIGWARVEQTVLDAPGSF